MKTIEVVAAVTIKDDKVFATQRGYVKWLPADLGLLGKIFPK